MYELQRKAEREREKCQGIYVSLPMYMFQRKAETAHRMLDSLGPKIELVSVTVAHIAVILVIDHSNDN